MSDTGLPSGGDAGPSNGPDISSGQDLNSGQNPATAQEPTGSNPAWGPLLESLPTNLHGIVKPHLTKFDSEFNSRLESERQRYAPYNSFIENKVDPGVIQGALQVMQMLESNPRDFYDRMGQFYANEWGLNQQQQPQDENDYSLDLDNEGEEPSYQDPRFDQLAQQQEVIANFLAQDVQRREQAEQAKQQEQFDKQLETEVESVKQQFGESFDQNALEMSLSFAIQNNISFPEAAQKVMQFKGAGGNAGPSAPTVLPTSGGTPSQAVNVGSLSRQDTRKLVEQRLAAAFGNQ